MADTRDSTFADPLHAALWYAQQGIPVFPVHSINAGRCACRRTDCANPGKHPISRLAPTGKNSATTEQQLICDWYQKIPIANIGLVTGTKSGFLVLDVDPRNGGYKTLAALEAKYGPLPLTWKTLSGGGGWHFYFSLPELIEFDIKSRPFAEGLDMKCEGGSIIAPPSLHVSGNRYAWENSPVTTSLQSPPDWLLRLLREQRNTGHQAQPATRPTEGQSTMTGQPSPGENILEGRRHATLVSLAGSMRTRGMSPEAIRAALREENRRRCMPPLAETEVDQIARSAEQWTGKSPLASEKSAPENRANVVVLSTVNPQEPSFLWSPYIPLGKVTLLEGDPKVGKSWLTINLAAIVTRGDPFPTQDGTPGDRREPGTVVLLTAEDALDDTVRRRADAAGADCSRIHVLVSEETRDSQSGEWRERSITLGDLQSLESTIRETQASLVIIDPIQAYLGADIDMHRANEVRPLLAALGRLAEKYRCAVLVIRHLTKASATRTIYRGLGSIDFTAAARSILLAAREPNNPSRRVLIHHACSIAQEGKTLGYELRDGQFFWTGESAVTVDQVLAADEPAAKSHANSEDALEERNSLEDAKEFLKAELAHGPRLVKDLEEEWKQAEHTKITIRRARAQLGVKSYSEGYGKKKVWLWRLPSTPLRRNGGDEDADSRPA